MTFPTRDEFLQGVNRAAARGRRSIPVTPPPIRDWLDQEVERMHRDGTLYRDPDDYPALSDYRDAPLKPEHLDAVRVVEKLLDDDPALLVMDAYRQAATLTGHPRGSLETWRARALRRGLIERRPVRRKPGARPGSAMTFSDNQKTRRNTDRERAAVQEVNEMLRQVPRPTVDEACKQVAPRYGVAWATVKKWRKLAVKDARQQQAAA